MASFRIEHDTWVLIADGEKALLLRNEGDAEYPNLQVIREIREENPPTREQGADRPGRLRDDAGRGVDSQRHVSAVQDTDWHRIAKERFADEIADRLYRMAHRGDFDKIVLVAPPLVLGEMRHKMHKEVEEKVVAEVAKTLTGHPVPEMEKILQAA